MWDPPVRHISEPHIMARMVVDLVRWCSVPGNPPFLSVMRWRRLDDFRVVADADAAWVLKVGRLSIHTPRALMHCFWAIWLS